MRILNYIMLVLAIGLTTDVMAYRPPAKSKPDVDKKQSYGTSELILRGGVCEPSESFAELSINNVRCRLLGGGDMWWDLDDGRYEVPKVEPGSGLDPVSSIFAGSVWIGGFDRSGSLKIAAIDYRSATSNEWWPGPIDERSGTTCTEDCDNWDQHFRVLGDNIRQHIANYNRSITDPTYTYTEDDVPSDILYWPASGNVFFTQRYGFELPDSRQGLGNFFETEGNENGIYEPQLGEYPQIDVRGCPGGIFADEMYFWLYNDVGNVHTNTQGDAIQMEVQVQAFAYQTTDEINDMTFYRYKLINRATEQIDSCYFAMWVDPDLGCYTDDYIGCDSSRSLMYIYNTDEVDGTSGCDCDQGVPTYCNNVPILGVDYFRGPLVPRVRDSITGKFRNPKINEPFDTIVEGGMSSFTYYNNGGIPGTPPSQADPQVGPQFYNYLSGSWTDGTRFTRGGTGYNPGSNDFTNFALYDPPNRAGGWSMCEAGLENGDRRTLQATGPMRLDPNTSNELIIGVVWVPDQQYPCPDLTELFGADQKAQDLFDNCFELPRGPDAPTVDIIELDRELILVLTNDPVIGSNNINEEYEEAGLGIPDGIEDSTYVFEGYRIYQVNGPDVTRQELSDPSKAREIFTIDVKNGITSIYNWESVPSPIEGQPLVYFPVLQVEGNDGGIRHTLRVTEDRFSRTADTRLVNQKEYYFYAVAYGYNNFDDFDADRAAGTQDEPYLEGRLNVGDRDRGGAPYIGVPRPLIYTDLNAVYGSGTVITRQDGIGVGGNFLDISEETEEAILDGTFEGEILYRPGRGPVDVAVYNPLEAVSGDFELKFYDDNMNNDELEDPIRWVLTSDRGDTVVSDKPLGSFNEQIIKEFGFSINIGQTGEPGEPLDDTDENNGLIGFELEYADLEKPIWFQGLRDNQLLEFNFQGNIFPLPIEFIDNSPGTIAGDEDPDGVLSSQILHPFMLTSYTDPTGRLVSPSWDDNSMGIVQSLSRMSNLNNVDIVFTSDKSKWSRCVVIETANEAQFAAGLLALDSREDFELRSSPSVGKDADSEGNPIPDGDGTGMGWFPGYAIDVETGERLNIFFGENSAYNQEIVDLYDVEFEDGKLNATDMVYNPSSQVAITELAPIIGAQNAANVYAGGHHYIYVTREPYDECAALRNALESGRSITIARALANVTYSCVSLLRPDANLLSYQDGLIPNDLRMKIRVDNPYQYTVGTGEHNGYNFYQFSFEGVEPEPKEEKDVVEDAMDDIKAVPNPYYGFSEYEVTQFDNFIKITNLPDKATVTIYGIDGSFIRQFRRDEISRPTTDRVNPGVRSSQTNPNLIWDLKNNRNISVSSGTYLIHVKDEVTGAEKTIKWFGIARKFDPSGL